MTSLKYGNSAHVKKFLVLGNDLMTKLYTVYLTENLKPYIELCCLDFYISENFLTLETYL